MRMEDFFRKAVKIQFLSHGLKKPVPYSETAGIPQARI
ncbi:hypothetical protein B4098_2153 [Heyndrickxia coagulans]|uniref:Uncharacterized protein n=1 Tax=Heyndrickxia coagulans TaxID=1398 RepID=A0A150K0A9_HEYCO|nr:hypothetical protein B4098_2153 [Heyndrickxia coagulans]